MIADNVIDEIKARTDIVDVIEGYVKLKKKGSDHIGLCPFHNEKSPSFYVSPVKRIYKCFGCGVSGDAVEFIMKLQHKSYPETLGILAEKYNIPFDYDAPKKEFSTPPPRLEKMEKTTIEYFEKHRGISNNTLLRFKVTDGMEWMPKAQKEVSTIFFNYYEDDKLVNIKYRAKDKDFKLHKDAKLVFYNIDSVKGQKEATVTEGEVDAMTAYECGFTSVASVPNGAGAGKLNLEYLDNCWEAFNGIEKIVLATDGDVAGRGLRQELARRLGLERCFQVQYPPDRVIHVQKTGETRPCKDLNEVLLHFGKEMVRDILANAKPWPIEGVLTVEDMQYDIQDYWENGFPSGLESGIPELDKLIRFQEGQFTTVTGAPGSGKSEFIDYIMASAVKKHGIKVAMLSFENQPSSFHATKIMQKLAGKAFAHRRDPYNRMSEEDFGRSLIKTNDHFFFLNINENNLTMEGILEKMGELVKRKGISFFVIDPWNYIEHNRQAGMSETEHVSMSLTKLKKFCIMTGTHCFLVAHPTKLKKENGKYEIPTLYSISGSAHFYNKTDNGITVHIDVNVFVYVQKVRYDWNGEKGYCEFFFNTLTRQYEPMVNGQKVFNNDFSYNNTITFPTDN